MPNKLDGIYKIYTDALNTASELAQITGRGLTDEEQIKAQECGSILRIFRKYGALQLGANVLNKHGQEYGDRLSAGISKAKGNIELLSSAIENIKQELKVIERDLEKLADGSAYTSHKGSIRKDPTLNKKRLLQRKASLQNKLKDLSKQKSDQESILGTNSWLLYSYNNTNNDSDAFFGAILDSLSDTETKLAEFAENLLRSVPNIGHFLIDPNRPNRFYKNIPLIKEGTNGKKKIDSGLLDFMIVYLEHPEMKKQLDEIENRETNYYYESLELINESTKDNRNQYSFGTEEYYNKIKGIDRVDPKQVLSIFERCLSNRYWAGRDLPISVDIFKPDLTTDFKTYREFYRQLSIDLTFKMTQCLLDSLIHIDKHISGKIFATDPLDGLAIKSGNPVEYIEPKTEEEVEFLPNIYLHEKYSELYKILSQRLIEMKKILTQKGIPIYNEQYDYYISVTRFPKNYAAVIANDAESYKAFVECLNGIVQDVKDYCLMNPQLASDLLRVYEPLLGMTKISISKLQEPLENVTYAELVSFGEYKNQLSDQVISAYSDFHMDALNGLILYYRKFLELAATLDEIEVKRLKESIQEEYNLPYQPLANIGRIEYFYTGYRHINYNVESGASERLTDVQKAEHDEWVTAYKRLCTIQKLDKFIRERENGPVILSNELISQLEQDLTALMNNQMRPVGEIKL